MAGKEMFWVLCKMESLLEDLEIISLQGGVVQLLLLFQEESRPKLSSCKKETSHHKLDFKYNLEMELLYSPEGADIHSSEMLFSAYFVLLEAAHTSLQ